MVTRNGWLALIGVIVALGLWGHGLADAAAHRTAIHAPASHATHHPAKKAHQ
jgi:hypothetical protein